jgi:hypothetical protein
MRSTRLLPWVVSGACVVAAPLGASADGISPARADAAETAGATDVAALYRRAVVHEARGESSLARSAYERVIAADRDHLAARRALGYERLRGRWLTGDALRRAKGFVCVGRRWLLAHEASPADPNLPRLRQSSAGLRSARAQERVLAAEEIAAIGDGRGIAILVGAWSRSEATPADGVFADTQASSYVGDYDVEVA